MPRDWAAWSFNVAYRDEEVNRANFGSKTQPGTRHFRLRQRRTSPFFAGRSRSRIGPAELTARFSSPRLSDPIQNLNALTIGTDEMMPARRVHKACRTAVGAKRLSGHDRKHPNIVRKPRLVMNEHNF